MMNKTKCWTPPTYFFIQGDLFQQPVMSGPFVPGGPTSQPPITSPDASARRALFQNRGQEGLGSTLSLGNESVLNQPTPQQIPEQDGVGDGKQNSGNAFQSPATPSYELL